MFFIFKRGANFAGYQARIPVRGEKIRLQIASRKLCNLLRPWHNALTVLTAAKEGGSLGRGRSAKGKSRKAERTKSSVGIYIYIYIYIRMIARKEVEAAVPSSSCDRDGRTTTTAAHVRATNKKKGKTRERRRTTGNNEEKDYAREQRE